MNRTPVTPGPRIRCWVLWLIALFPLFALAVPADVDALAAIATLQPIISGIKNGRPTGPPDQLTTLRQAFASQDPAVLAIAAWCLGCLQNPEAPALLKDLQTRRSGQSDLSDAYIEIAAISHTSSAIESDEKLKRAAQKPNPYLKIEAAKLLAKKNPPEGVALMKTLLASNEIPASLQGVLINALNAASRPDQQLPPLPVADDRYVYVLEIVE